MSEEQDLLSSWDQPQFMPVEISASPSQLSRLELSNWTLIAILEPWFRAASCILGSGNRADCPLKSDYAPIA